MTRGYAASGGSITVTSTGGGVTYGDRTILTGCYGVEHRINIIHDQDNYIRWYVNGVLKCEQLDTEVGVTNYHKYGCYGTTSGNVPAIVKWRAVRNFRDGFPPGQSVTPTPRKKCRRDVWFVVFIVSLIAELAINHWSLPIIVQ